jgi:hypothetical protein
MPKNWATPLVLLPLAETEIPGGSVPLATDTEYGALPPVMAQLPEYGEPNGPDMGPHVKASAAVGCTTKLLLASVAVCAGEPLSVTLRVNALVPAVVGTPVMFPLALSVIPAGSDPLLTE